MKLLLKLENDRVPAGGSYCDEDRGNELEQSSRHLEKLLVQQDLKTGNA